ncbi:23S rRNA (uracil(1939)-C(5))-methyltransferase RlmD [Acidaminobacter sp. JC074]|uniref:23S rRNA (uracil(1939)-C(5))-methyltransferase RlmD n=1 Tax=Acidaminobacter sp. JC074 TaxID=2530199 RepID=UPI001F0DAA8D|nr:23S rRNA (uracil(1939)-C(5))-methyltransferase RlmD [Acidaminobacter sp. JC074]MCH4889859.1 23S rRNA (uracil(1939)-C(5))-methyltransferase RlmD [Acidaminobacter sp. JC074]
MSKKFVETQKNIRGKALYYDENGCGVVEQGKMKIPVPFLLKDEVADLFVVKQGKYFTSRIDKLIETSNDRVKPKCEYYTSCGGCQLMHMSYDAQLKFKTKYVKGLYKGYKVEDTIGMDDPYAYRNKMISTFKFDKKIKSGFYKLYSHDVVSIKKCLVQDDLADPIMETIRQLANQYKLKVFNEDKKSGFLRHVLIRTGHYSREVLVVLVVADRVFPGKGQFIKALVKRHPEIKTIIQNVNKRQTSVVLGEEEHILYGSGTIKDQLMGLTFNISSKSFYQINPVQTEKLYGLAIEMADLKEKDLVIDTYSGIGTISLIAAKKANKVFGVEINKAAIKNAIKNAKINKISNVQFVEGDAGKIMVQMAKERVPVTTVFMDPPRSGSDEKFLSSIVKLKPKKVIYISCNPATQKRDVDYLLKRGYELERIVPVDMFSHTNHVESVCKLKLKK